jgi:photosystem II stability/assembly factor-like uncharacterized protein
MKIFKYALLPIILIGIFITACKKEGNTTNNSGFQIKIVKGENQTDTVGRSLKDTLVFKATNNNDTVVSGFVEIYTYDCDGNRRQGTLYNVGRGAYNSLYIPYVWILSGDVGNQRLTAVLLDSYNNPKDSITVIANALPPSHGWYRTGCFPLNNFVQSFTQLPSGRILAALRQTDYPYFSDDEGMTWHVLTTVPSKNNYAKVISTASNEVFLAINAQGILYSSNGGSTWEARNNGLPLGNFWGDLQYTKSGKLFSLTGDGIFKSDDKGLNWHQVTFGLYAYTGFSNASSTSDSTIYVKHNTLIQSTDGGETFRPVYTFENADYFFIDDNDDMYATEYDVFGQADMGMYVSRDHTQSWNKMYSLAPPNANFQLGIGNMTKHGNSYFFYSTTQNLLVQTHDFNSFYTYTPPVIDDNGRQSFQYIVTQQGHIIISNEFQGIFYFIP